MRVLTLIDCCSFIARVAFLDAFVNFKLGFQQHWQLQVAACLAHRRKLERHTEKARESERFDVVRQRLQLASNSFRANVDAENHLR